MAESERRKLEFVGEAKLLPDGRYLVAHPDRSPFILDMRDGQKYDLTVKVTDWPEPAKVFQPRLVNPRHPNRNEP